MPKQFIVSIVAVLVFMLGYVAFHGHKYRTTGDTLALEHHRGGTNCVLWLLALSIILIELMVSAQPSAVRPALFWVHLPLAITFMSLFLLMRFKLTGLKSKAHRPLAYLCLGTFVGALATGGMLLWQRM